MSQPDDFEKPLLKAQQSGQSLLPPSVVTKKKRRSWERIHPYNIAILTFGTVVIVAVLGLLTMMWAGSNFAARTGQMPAFWRVMFWDSPFTFTQMVTTSSVVLRFATSLHLGVFAAIFAALILERAGASMKDLPYLSMIRNSNSGPTSLIQTVLHSMTVKSHLGYSVLIILAILDAAVLQFTSTILQNDFGDVLVRPPSQLYPIPYGLRDPQGDVVSVEAYQGVDFWRSAPATYLRFAEGSEARSQGDNWLDTGKTYRGFMPMTDLIVRQGLRNYTGPMTVIDARVICVQPTFSNAKIDPGSDTVLPTIASNLTLGATHPLISQYPWTDRSSAWFNCSLPTQHSKIPKSYAPYHWALAICDIGGKVAEFDEPPMVNSTQDVYQPPLAWLVLNVTGNTTQWSNSLSGLNQSVEQMSAPDSSWASVGRGDLRVDASVCVHRPMLADFNLTAWNPDDIKDPQIIWNSTTGMYDTLKVRQLLGATSQDLLIEERDVFRMEAPSNWSTVRVSAASVNYTQEFLWVAVMTSIKLGESGILPTFFLTNYAQENGIHRSHVAIFQDIMHDTRNPALAMQALLTNLMSSAYYDFLPQFDVEGTSILQLSFNQTMPHQWTYLGVVAGLLGIHFFCIFIAISLFINATRTSLLGNAWQPILQVANEERVHAIPPNGQNMTDTEIWKVIKPESKVNGRIRIGWKHLGDWEERTVP